MENQVLLSTINVDWDKYIDLINSNFQQLLLVSSRGLKVCYESTYSNCSTRIRSQEIMNINI